MKRMASLGRGKGFGGMKAPKGALPGGAKLPTKGSAHMPKNKKRKK